jgi:hypothetical protein
VIGSYLSSPRKLQVISCWRFPGCPRCYAPERSFNHTNLPGHRRSPSYHHQAPISISAIQVAPRSGGKPSRDRPYIYTLGRSQADLRCRLWQRMRVEIVLRRHDERTSNSRLLSPKKRKESAIGVPPPSTGQDWQTFPGGSAHLHWLLPSYSAQKKVMLSSARPKGSHDNTSRGRTANPLLLQQRVRSLWSTTGRVIRFGRSKTEMVFVVLRDFPPINLPLLEAAAMTSLCHPPWRNKD